MKILAGLYIFSMLFVGCQSKPTKLIEESVNPFAENSVIVDTRSALEYASFHIEGSVNLNSSDFLILKDPRKKIRIMDPDISQTIERLANKGIAPDRKIFLLADREKSIESKKWSWLLKSLEVEDVLVMTLDQFRKEYKNRRFAVATAARPWYLKTSEEFQKELILKKSKDCFVNWSEKQCSQ